MTLITWLSWNMFKRVPKCVRWFWRFYGSLTLTHKFGRQANASTIEDFRRCQIRTKATSTPPHFFVCVCQRVLFSPVYCKRFTDQSCSSGSGVLSIQHTVVGLLLQLYWWLCTRNCWRAWIQVASWQISSYAFCFCVCFWDVHLLRMPVITRTSGYQR